jgi:hypothetical protein
MPGRVDIRRSLLTLLLCGWLSAQFAVIGMTPAWGVTVPHEHVTRGVPTESAWQQHLLEHRRGFVRAQCDTPDADGTNPIMASMPPAAEALSLFSAVAAHLGASTEIPAPHPRQVAFYHPRVFSFDISYSPPVPPPNL